MQNFQHTAEIVPFPLRRGSVGHPVDHVEPVRIARMLHEPVDLYGGFRPTSPEPTFREELAADAKKLVAEFRSRPLPHFLAFLFVAAFWVGILAGVVPLLLGAFS